MLQDRLPENHVVNTNINCRQKEFNIGYILYMNTGLTNLVKTIAK